MRSEKLNTQLYNKMVAEQAKYRDWLLTLPAADVLDHASEYSFREDILVSLEGQSLTAAQAKALLRSPTPVADVYQDWEMRDPNYMEDIWETMERQADRLVHYEREKLLSREVR